MSKYAQKIRFVLSVKTELIRGQLHFWYFHLPDLGSTLSAIEWAPVRRPLDYILIYNNYVTTSQRRLIHIKFITIYYCRSKNTRCHSRERFWQALRPTTIWILFVLYHNITIILMSKLCRTRNRMAWR